MVVQTINLVDVDLYCHFTWVAGRHIQGIFLYLPLSDFSFGANELFGHFEHIASLPD